MAATRQTTTYWHPTPTATRRGPGSLLRGAKLYKGAVAVNHNGRLMPAGSFDNAAAIADGGPLSVPGADANGGLRLIAKRRGVSFELIDGASIQVLVGFVSVTETRVTLICPVATTAAVIAVEALWGHAYARELIDAAWTGTGNGLVLAAASASVPYVLVVGMVPKDLINESATEDKALDEPLDFEFGRVFLANSGSVPVSKLDIGSIVRLADDITIAQNTLPLCMHFQLTEFSPDRGPAVYIP